MKYTVKEFRPGLFHVMAGIVPVHDESRDGADKALVFTDANAADEAAKLLNKAEGEPL